MKTIDSEIQIIDEILNRKKRTDRGDVIEYMSCLFHYYHENINIAKTNSEHKEKVNWVYVKIKQFLDVGIKLEEADEYLERVRYGK